MSAIDSTSGLFPDSLLYPIQDQAVEQFKVLREEMPEIINCAFPKTYASRIRRLFGAERLSTMFRAIMYLEEIKETDEEGAICVFLPNDEDYAKEAIPYLKMIPNYKIFILVSPISGYFFNKVFEDNQFSEDQLQIFEFHFDLLILEPYLFLIQAPHCFTRLYVKGEMEDLVAAARALTKIQVLNGDISHVYAIGQQSMRINSIMQEQKAQIGMSSFAQNSVYDAMIIIDRSIDLLTPLLNQLSYNGLIDQYLNCDCGYIKLPTDTGEFQNAEELLTDGDPVFARMRSMTPEAASDYLNNTLTGINNFKTVSQSAGEMSAKKFQQTIDLGYKYVNEKPFNLKNSKILSYVLTQIAPDSDKETQKEIGLFDFNSILGLKPPPIIAEKLVLKDEDWTEAVREFCISSICMDGIKTEPISAFRVRLVSRFGVEFIDDIVRMAMLKILYEHQHIEINVNFVGNVVNTIISKAMSYKKVARLFNLCLDINKKEYADQDRFEVDKYLFNGSNPPQELLQKVKSKNPKDKSLYSQDDFSDMYDIGGAYDGYVPLTARLVQTCIEDAYFKSTDDKKSKLRSQDVQKFFSQKLVDEDYQKQNIVGVDISKAFPNGPQTMYSFPTGGFFENESAKRKIIVFIVGGVTSSEALAIKQVGTTLFKGKIDITIGSTSILTNRGFLHEICPTLKLNAEGKN